MIAGATTFVVLRNRGSARPVTMEEARSRAAGTQVAVPSADAQPLQPDHRLRTLSGGQTGTRTST